MLYLTHSFTVTTVATAAHSHWLCLPGSQYLFLVFFFCTAFCVQSVHVVSIRRDRVNRYHGYLVCVLFRCCIVVVAA